MPSAGSIRYRLNKPALDALGKYDSNPDAAILKMQNRIKELEEQKGITGVPTCGILTDPKMKPILKALIKEACEEALGPHIGQP